MELEQDSVVEAKCVSGPREKWEILAEGGTAISNWQDALERSVALLNMLQLLCHGRSHPLLEIPTGKRGRCDGSRVDNSIYQ